MDFSSVLKSALLTLQKGNIPVCVVGEVALNYYNVPRVVHDIEICVPKDLLSEAVSILCSTGQFRLEERTEYDIYTEYKRGFPTLKLTLPPNLTLIIFPATYFHLSLPSQTVGLRDGKPSVITYSRQIMDLVSADEIKDLPMPCLAPYFIGLCLRFFESNDYMARIAVEQLVDGMKLDEQWLRSNLSDATVEVQQLATRLVDERLSSNDEFLDMEAVFLAAEGGKQEDIRWIPGSGFQ